MYPALQAPYIAPPRIRDLAADRLNYQVGDVADQVPGGGKLRNDTDFFTVQRIPFNKLYNAYGLDPMAGAAVNFYVSMIQDSGGEVISDDAATQTAIDELLNPIRDHFNEVFFQLAPMNLGIYGNAWIEHMAGPRSGKVRNFTIANSVRMDFIRIDEAFRQGPVSLLAGRETGYVQWNDEIGSEKVFFNRSEMTHLHMNRPHFGELGFGIIEGMFSDIQLKQNMEEALTASAFLSAFRRPVYEFGNTESRFIGYHPGARLQRQMKVAAADIVDKGTDYILLPPHLRPNKDMPYYEPGKLDATHMDYLNFQSRQLAGISRIPLALLLQSGDATAQDLEVLLDFFMSAVRQMQRALRIPQIIRNALDINGQPHEDIKMKVRPIMERTFKDANLGFLRGVKGLRQLADDEVTDKFGEVDIDLSSSEVKQNMERALEIGIERNIIR